MTDEQSLTPDDQPDEAQPMDEQPEGQQTTEAETLDESLTDEPSPEEQTVDEPQTGEPQTPQQADGEPSSGELTADAPQSEEPPSDGQTADEQVAGAPSVGRPEPPRAFDDETPLEDSSVASSEEDAADVEPEVVATGVEPEAPEAFEDLDQLPSLLEALLFVADHPIDVPYLSRAVEVSQARVERALEDLGESLRESGRGIRVQRGPAGVQLTTAPEAATFVERFLGLEATRRLSTAALETLAIIAYRQPITRGQIDAIRGVSSDGAVATLRARDLIESAGHAPGPGRPMLFRTSGRFLEHFGLERPGQLPPLPDDVDLPPSEIQATLGLDEATVEEALRPRDADGDEVVGGDEVATGDEAAAPESGAEALEPAAAEDDERTPEDEALDELIHAVAASEAIGVDIPADVEALSAAAEQAFIASRDRGDVEISEDEREQQ